MKSNNDISDEMLATFLDGNASGDETLDVLQAIGAEPEISETMRIALEVDDDMCACYDTLPMMKLAAESGDNICSVLCETYVLHRRGIAFDEKDVFATARKNHWLTPQGTPLHTIGQLLVQHGLMVSRVYDATIDDIRKALDLDNDILVVVDRDKLYPQLPDDEDDPNHAVVVLRADAATVVVFDPKEGMHCSVDTSDFLKAWHESRNYMVRVLQTVDDYIPSPISLDEIHLSDDLLELQEAIAENAHEVWAAARMEQGWTYGPERDDANRKHPDLVPYSALPDSEKEYDRIMALNTIKLVAKLGYNLERRK